MTFHGPVALLKSKNKTPLTFCERSEGVMERWRQKESQLLSQILNSSLKSVNVVGRNMIEVMNVHVIVG